jgi:hypothetical protein
LTYLSHLPIGSDWGPEEARRLKQVMGQSSEMQCSLLRLGGKRQDLTRSPFGGAKASTRDVAAESVKLFRIILLCNSAQDPPGLEAIAVVVIEHDNLTTHPDREAHKAKHGPTRVLHSSPAPQVGDPLHYQTFIQRICSQFVGRFP